MTEFLDGASFLAAAAVTVFFLRFWRATGDRLFLFFALAFAVLAANRVVLALLDEADEAETLVYVARALAFALILLAIVRKNRDAP